MSFRNISAWAIRNPVPPIVLFIALTLAGIVSFMRMDVNNDPDIDFPVVIVVISQPGAAPTELARYRRHHLDRHRGSIDHRRPARDRHADRPRGQRHARQDRADPQQPARRHPGTADLPRGHDGQRSRQLFGDRQRHDGRTA
jgi:hypothetical protein